MIRMTCHQRYQRLAHKRARFNDRGFPLSHPAAPASFPQSTYSGVTLGELTQDKLTAFIAKILQARGRMNGHSIVAVLDAALKLQRAWLVPMTKHRDREWLSKWYRGLSAAVDSGCMLSTPSDGAEGVSSRSRTFIQVSVSMTPLDGCLRSSILSVP